ncbi:MAG: T9SS type A sorting domain-containing protein [Balneolaceae bacterium]
MKKHLLLLLSVFIFSPSLIHAQVDYDSEIQPIFSAKCISCHIGSGTNGVILSSYSAVMESVGEQYGTEVVVPGDAENSPLVDKISSDNPEYGVRMPQTGNYLSSNEIDLIVTWINEGANEVPTSNELIANLPDGFELKGNYPNPFNPTTNILFEVPESASYTVSVYALHGALVTELAGKTSAGSVSVSVNFGDEPSGIYFYKVTASANNNRYLIGTGRMTLVK